MIVCLGWGSLIWNPRCLPVGGEWHNDGPELPIEFTRQSADGRLTLVLDHQSKSIPVLWAPLALNSLPEAIEALRVREGTVKGKIGSWPSDSWHDYSDTIEQWANAGGFSGVVWTALGHKFNGEDGRRPSQQEAVDYLSNLPAKPCYRVAEEYVRKAPAQIDTAYRRAIAKNLGWNAI